MILRLNANSKNFQNELIKKINKRSVFSNKDYNIAKKIVLDVKKNGDKAVLKYEFKFNKNKKIKSKYSNISNYTLIVCFELFVFIKFFFIF